MQHNALELHTTIYAARILDVSHLHRLLQGVNINFAELTELAQEAIMEKSDMPFAGFSATVVQNFEQTRKAMEKYLDFLKANMTAPQWFASPDLNKKMQNYTEQNIAAASDFAKKLTQARDFGEFWRIQTEFIQAQGAAFAEQMKDLGETATKSAMGPLKNVSS